MYKIYFGDRLLWVVENEETALRQSRRALLVRYNAEQYHLLNSYIALLMQSEKEAPDAVILQTTQAESLFYTISKMFNIQEAAGGLVYNPDGKILAIYRRGSWDLAKGKIDAGELPPQAALREVEEETGLKQIELHDFIGCTYHVFSDRGGLRTLKKTHWWTMTAPTQELVPQKEEDIEKAVWINPNDLMNKRPIYASILDILQQKHPAL